MHGAWVRFVTDHRVDWPTWHPDRAAMVFDAASHVIRDAYALERRLAAATAAAADVKKQEDGTTP